MKMMKDKERKGEREREERELGVNPLATVYFARTQNNKQSQNLSDIQQ